MLRKKSKTNLAATDSIISDPAQNKSGKQSSFIVIVRPAKQKTLIDDPRAQA